MKILIDAYQQHRLNSTGANPNLTENAAEVDDLRRRVDTLAIACQALWEILQSQTGMDEAAILEKMTQIDARDGRLDGKAAPAVLECAACHRRGNAGQTVCLYCGASLEQAPAVEPPTTSV